MNFSKVKLTSPASSNNASMYSSVDPRVCEMRCSFSTGMTGGTSEVGVASL